MQTMKSNRLILVAAVSLGAVSHKAHAIGNGGSYHAIVHRNAFRLNSLPLELTAPAPLPNLITLTGITTIGGKKKVFLEITRPGFAKQPFKPILEEGQSEAGV